MYRPNIATFRGSHNRSKSLVLLLLLDRRARGLPGLGVKALASNTGVPYNSLRALLGNWVKWGYLTRKVSKSNTDLPIYSYSIATRGEHFVKERIPRDKLSEYAMDLAVVKSTLLVRAKAVLAKKQGKEA